MLCKFFPSFPALVSTYPRYCRTISKVLTKLQLAAAYFFSPFRGEFSCILDGWESQSCFSLNFPTPTQYYTLWWPPKNSAKCRHVQLLRDIYSEKGKKLVSNYLSLIDFLHGNGNVHRAIIHFGLLSEKIFFSLEFWCYCATLPQCETMIMLMKLFILINSADRGRYSFKPLIHQR